jgi:hypothetical protein
MGELAQCRHSALSVFVNATRLHLQCAIWRPYANPHHTDANYSILVLVRYALDLHRGGLSSRMQLRTSVCCVQGHRTGGCRGPGFGCQ